MSNSLNWGLSVCLSSGCVDVISEHELVVDRWQQLTAIFDGTSGSVILMQDDLVTEFTDPSLAGSVNDALFLNLLKHVKSVHADMDEVRIFNLLR